MADVTDAAAKAAIDEVKTQAEEAIKAKATSKPWVIVGAVLVALIGGFVIGYIV